MSVSCIVLLYRSLWLIVSFSCRFSSVIGDAFHFMDRPKVPVHHSSKKGYFVALRHAWFMFDPIAFKALTLTDTH